MATFENRDGNWRAKIRRKGFPSESATFDTKAEARAWATQRESELQDVRRGKIIPRTVAQGLEKYRTQVSPTHDGARWEDVRCRKLERTLPFALRLIAEVQPADIAMWRDHALKGNLAAGIKPLAPASVRREWALLRSMFEVARKEWGWASANPMDEVKRPPKPRARDQRWSDSEVDRMIAALGYERWKAPQTVQQRVALAFLFALETAMREGEICAIRWEDVHLDARFVHLPKSKNGDERDVPITKQAEAILRLLEDTDDCPFGLITSQVDANFRKARARAGIGDRHFHDSRANAIERLSKKLEILDLARAVGHRDLKSLMIYYRKSATELAKQLG
ncbi:MAG: site-specific integrase [Casimicrobiaceae bacterium]